MILGILFAAFSVVFPKEGSVLPPVSACYVIGSVSRDVKEVRVNGEPVEVYRTGAWATRVPVEVGTNTLHFAWKGRKSGESEVTFRVPPKPVVKVPRPDDPPPVPVVWNKLPFASDTPQPPPHGKRPGEILIVLDPGHGGSDPGALSPHGFPEKSANLLLAQAVATELIARGYRAQLTRTKDETVALYDRPENAHKMKADAFVSIHHNAPRVDADPFVRYRALYAWNTLGECLAKAISAKLDEVNHLGCQNNGVKHGNLAVTRNPEIPSCLIEADFLTAPEGEAAIWNGKNRVQLASAIAEGIVAWCQGQSENDASKTETP